MGRKITSHRGNEKIQYLAKLHAIKFENLKQMMRVKEMSLKKKKNWLKTQHSKEGKKS